MTSSGNPPEDTPPEVVTVKQRAKGAFWACSYVGAAWLLGKIVSHVHLPWYLTFWLLCSQLSLVIDGGRLVLRSISGAVFDFRQLFGYLWAKKLSEESMLGIKRLPDSSGDKEAGE